jgi:hypothetical protein
MPPIRRYTCLSRSSIETRGVRTGSFTSHPGGMCNNSPPLQTICFSLVKLGANAGSGVFLYILGEEIKCKGCELDLTGLEYTVSGSCQNDNGLSGCISGGKFHGRLSDYQLLEKDSAPWN